MERIVDKIKRTGILPQNLPIKAGAVPRRHGR